MARLPYLRTLRPGQLRPDESEEIREEIELYLDLRAAELEAGGMSAEEARRVARERFGDTERIERELRREARRQSQREGWTMTIHSLRQDMGYALRGFRRSPGFALVAVLTLGLALGGNTAIFSVVDAALLSALPFEEHEELVFLNGYHLVDGEVSIRGASFPEFRDWRERSRSVARMAALTGSSFALTGEGEAERLAAEVVTEGYFEVLGVTAARGRTFHPDEHTSRGTASVAIISDGLWERRYGRDPAVVGSSIVLDDQPMSVIGVMPAGFGGTNLTTELWVPDAVIGARVHDSRGSRFLTVIGRLAPGADIEAAQAELDVIARDLQAAFPRAHEDRFSQVVSFREGYLGTTGGLLWILMGAGLVLLLIAAANVANLLLVRSHGRTRELVLRRALGAQPRRIAGQVLSESTLLAGLGGVLGIGVALAALRILGPMIPSGVLPGYVEPELSASAFVFSLAALALVGVATGLVPALSSARLDIASRLREGARSASAGGPGRFRSQHVFVVAQVALALVLMVGAGLLTRSFRAQMSVDTGSDLDGVVAMRTQLPSSRFDSDDEIWNFAREVEREVTAVPGVRSAALASDLPFRGGTSASYIFREGEGADDRIRYHRHAVTAGYFETLGIEIVEGRGFTADDVDGAPGVILITSAMARRVYPGESAIGKTMTLRPDGEMPVEVVGVVEDVRFRDVTTSLMADANSPDVFFSFWQIPSRGLEIVARNETGATGAETLLPPVRAVLAELDPDLPAYQLATLREAWLGQTATPRFAAFLMTLFSALAAALACVGVYGVLAFSVGQRSQEIAIRRAIGASGARVARSVVVSGLRLSVAGLVIGALVASGGARVLEGFLYGVETDDPLTYASVGAGMVLVAALAAVVPALRATRRAPADALSAD